MRRHLTARTPCPVCTGHAALPRGRGSRCAGYTSDDGLYVHCTRDQYAGDLTVEEKTVPATWTHFLGARCQCGTDHRGVGTVLTSWSPDTAISPERKPTTPWDDGDLGPGSRVVTRYPYRDEAGALAYRVVRFRTPEGKSFRPEQAAPGGQWYRDLTGVRRLPYRLPELLAEPQRVLWVVEGEKDVDRLAGLGLLATTCANGAHGWTGSVSDALAGRPYVVVVPDNDLAGRLFSGAVIRSLAGRVGAIAELVLPGLPERGDVSDFLDAGHTVEELRALAQAALCRVQVAA